MGQAPPATYKAGDFPNGILKEGSLRRFSCLVIGGLVCALFLLVLVTCRTAGFPF